MKTNEVSIDITWKKLWPFILIISIVIVWSIGYFMGQTNQSLEYSYEDKILRKIDYYMSLEHMNIGSIDINNNMKLSDIQQLYWKWKNQPISKSLTITMYEQLCQG